MLVVLYQDRGLVVVDKPAGLPTETPRGGGESVESRTGLRACHRLDTPTTGVLVLARDAATLRRMNDAFASRQVRKAYLAVTTGTLPDTGRCDLPLGEWSRGRVRVGSGRSAQTSYWVRERKPGRLLVEAEPVTGRTHQVRAHLSASGAPIVGDEAYGGEPAVALALHAWWLELPWPNEGDLRMVMAAPPPAFQAAWGTGLSALPRRAS